MPKNKLIAAFLAVAFLISLNQVSAQTLDEAQATIDSLLRQVESLQSQLNALLLGGTEIETSDTAPTSGGTTGTTGTSGSCVDLKRDLSRGMSGSDVSELQRFLVASGYMRSYIITSSRNIFSPLLPVPTAKSSITGYFGSLTADAVKKFQEKERLAGAGYGTGYVGIATRSKIKNLTCGSVVTPPSTSAPSVDLKANNSDGPITLASGQSLWLTWTTANTNQCELSAPSVNLLSGADGYGGSSGPITPGHPFYPSSAGTTYTIKCWFTVNPSQTSSDSVTVTIGSVVNPPPTVPVPTVDIKANQSDSPLNVSLGSTVVLSWGSQNTTACTASWLPWPPTQSTEGKIAVNPIQNTTYTITCTGSGGTATDSVTVNVSPGIPSEGLPIVTLSANPTAVTSGQPVTLFWSSSNASSCSASGGWSGTKATSGNQTFYPSQTTTYTLACSGSGGSTSKSVTVNFAIVDPKPAYPAPTVTIVAVPVSIQAGQSTSLGWFATNATSCTASGAWSGTRNTSGYQILFPSQTSTYTLACSGSGGSTSQSATVSVSTAPAPAPTVDIKANGTDGPTSIAYGGSVTLSWASANASSCTSVSSNPYDVWASQALNASGSKTIPGMILTTTFSISCKNSSGQTASDSATVNVGSAPTQALSADIKANGTDGPITLSAGQRLELSWASAGASYCVLSPNVYSSPYSAGSSITVPSNSAVSLNPGGIGYPTTSQAYTIQCYSGSQSASDSVIVNLPAGRELLRGPGLSNLASILQALQQILSQLQNLAR